MLTGLNAAGDARAQLPLASVEFKLGMLLRTLGNGTAARERYGQAREMIRRLAVRRPEDRKILDLACEVYAESTRFAADSGKPQEAREAAGEATVMARRLVALDPSSAESRDYLSAAQVSLGKAYLSSYQLESAVQNFRDALDIREQLVREQPENA